MLNPAATFRSGKRWTGGNTVICANPIGFPLKEELGGCSGIAAVVAAVAVAVVHGIERYTVRDVGVASVVVVVVVIGGRRGGMVVSFA